ALEQRVRIFDLRAPVLAISEHPDIVHRAGPVERDQCNDVAKTGPTNGGEGPAHAFGFELEHADRVSALDQLVDRRIVPPQLIEIDLDAVLGEKSASFLQDREGFEAEEVELHQARSFDIFHVELRYRH